MIVSVTVTTCNYQPETSQDQAGLDICDVRSYTATNNQIHRVCPSAWLCSAALLYLNTGSNIETKGQMSGPKPEPASGGGYG